MPIHEGEDNKGKFFQYGTSGYKYHFKTEQGRKSAYMKCLKQKNAILWSQNKNK